MFVLVKVLTPVRTSSTLLIECFSLSSRKSLIYTQIMIESLDSMWFYTLSCKIIRFHCNQFDKCFCFFNYMFVFKNKPKWSFLYCTQVLKIECPMECPSLSGKFVHTSRQRGSKQLLPAKKSRRGCTFFIPHVSKYKSNNNVTWLATFFKKLFRHN